MHLKSGMRGAALEAISGPTLDSRDAAPVSDRSA
jgi:hypothetical protein